MRFWVSWYQTTEDHRPLTYPPNSAVLGWWNSGSRCMDDAATLCAVVQATSDRAAKAAVRKDWPEASEWRFCEQKTPDFKPGDRFPIGGWMTERFEEKPK